MMSRIARPFNSLTKTLCNVPPLSQPIIMNIRCHSNESASLLQNKRSVVVSRVPANKMKLLRALQGFSHVILVSFTGVNCGGLAVSAYQLYQHNADPYIYFSCGLVIPSLFILFVPVVCSSIIGRLELNNISKTVKVSHLDLFGRRCDKTVHLQNCYFSREQKPCKLDKNTKNIQIPYLILWQNCVEEAAEYISDFTSKDHGDSVNYSSQYGPYPRLNSAERKYIQILGFFIMLVITVRTYQMKNEVPPDEWEAISSLGRK